MFTIKTEIAVMGVSFETLGGTALGSTAVCANSNYGIIELSGHVGLIEKWQFLLMEVIPGMILIIQQLNCLMRT
jgi:hypothetical protein